MSKGDTVAAPEPGKPAPDFGFETASGQVRLSDLWKKGPLVVVFLRHFG